MSNMIIFLDIDGVLNQLQQNYYLDNNCIKNLGILCNKLNADIVLSSSWRLGYSNYGKSSPQIEKLKQMFNENNIKIIGRTKAIGNRKEEIEDYIREHGINNYIIIDDDTNEFNGHKTDNLYVVNNQTGLTKNDVKNIIRMI